MTIPSNFMPTAMAITAIFVLCSAVDASAYVPVPSAPVEVILYETGAKQPQDRGERMISETFNLQAGGLLNIDVPDADIQVETTKDGPAQVDVFLAARNMRRARDYFEDLSFEVSEDDNTVYVLAHQRQRTLFEWTRTGGARILVLVQIPVEFNLEISTSDGDVRVGDVVGKVDVNTSDGDIHTGTIDGPVVSLRSSDGDIRLKDLYTSEASIRTSDGDIEMLDAAASSLHVKTSDGHINARVLEGSVELETGDGDIELEKITGSTAWLSTADGDIVVDQLEAANSELRTSDGDLRMGKVYGDVLAITSSGSIRVEMAVPAHIYCRTSDGDVTVHAPEDLAADVKMEGDRIRISSSFDFQGTIQKERAAGSINGGGPVIEAYTSDGSVVLREN